MTRRLAQACLTALLGAALVGCGAGGRKPGAVAGASAGSLPKLSSMAAQAQGAGVRFGQGGQGAEAPAIAQAGDGSWVLAFVGTQTGDKKLFVSTSADGQAWSAATPLPGARAYSDQAPSLAVDPQGTVHLGFLSNRDGQDWVMYHATMKGGAFGEAKRVEGFGGGMDLAIAFHGEKLVVAAELRGVGLVLAEGPADSTSFEEAELVTEQGFEPALAQGPEGQLALAYRRGDALLAQLGTPGQWSAATPLVAGGDGVKRRQPSLAWGEGGLLAAWSEAGAFKALRLAPKDLAASAGPSAPALASGEAAQATALAWGAGGKLLGAWGLQKDGQFAVGASVIAP